MASLFALFFSAALALANSGGMERGGGDPYSQRFVELGNRHADILDAWQEMGLAIVPEVDAKAFRLVVKETEIRTQKTTWLKKRGKRFEVAAINIPGLKRIILSRSRWDAMSDLDKERLVFHEYLGIMRLKDAKYEISSRYWAQVLIDRDDRSFRARLKDELQPLGHAMIRDLHFDFSAAAGALGALKASSDYVRCTRRGANMSNADDLSACLMVAKQMEGLAKFFTQASAKAVDADQTTKTLDERARRFLSAIENESHKAFGILMYRQLVEKYNTLADASAADVRNMIGSLDPSCPGRLNEAIVCALGIIDKFVNQQAILTLSKRKAEMKATFEQVLLELDR